MSGIAEALSIVPFEKRDLEAGRASFACHRTQYAPAEMDAVNAYLAHAWNGTVWLRPWNGPLRDTGLFSFQAARTTTTPSALANLRQ